MTGHDPLRARVRDHFGVDLTTLEPVTAGADTAAEVWRGTTADGTRYAVKRTGGGSMAGLRIPARLAELGIRGIVAPVPARDGALCAEHDGRRLSLLPWVSDDDGLDGRMTRAHWESFGRLLSAVHQAPADEVAPAGAGGEAGTDGEAGVGGAVAAIDAVGRIGRRLQDVPGDELTRDLAAAWRAGAALLAGVRHRVTVLDAALRAGRDGPAAPAVVCHTDAHLGNVLLGDAGDVWLIDWDDAAAAPRERDLMFVVGGLPGFAPVGHREQEWFFTGYGAVELDPDLLSYYRGVRALDDIAELATEVLDGADETERARWLAFARTELAGAGLAGLALHDAP